MIAHEIQLQHVIQDKIQDEIQSETKFSQKKLSEKKLGYFLRPNFVLD